MIKLKKITAPLVLVLILASCTKESLLYNDTEEAVLVPLKSESADAAVTVNDEQQVPALLSDFGPDENDENTSGSGAISDDDDDESDDDSSVRRSSNNR